LTIVEIALTARTGVSGGAIVIFTALRSRQGIGTTVCHIAHTDIGVLESTVAVAITGATARAK